jgi:hypothetical protein
MTRPHPQRIFAPSRPGSLLKRAPSPPAPRKDATDQDADYLKLVRQCPCLHCGMDPCYEAAHVRMASAAHGKASGLNKKPPDRWALPLCPDHHRLLATCQHHRGEQLFWDELGINALMTCAKLYAQRGDLVAMRAVVFTTISKRGLTDGRR